MAKQLDNHTNVKVTQKDAVRLNRDARIRKDERRRMFRRGAPVIFMFTITAGVYGYSLGRKHGYLDGVNAGFVKGGQELMSTWREYSEELRMARENDI